MGADGHVEIYDRKKFEDNFGSEKAKEFYEHFLSAQFYLQELDGKPYLTRYYGDNYSSDDAYHVIQTCYDPEKDECSKHPWLYDEYHVECFMKLRKPKRKQFSEMIKFLEKECLMTTWEVWT